MNYPNAIQYLDSFANFEPRLHTLFAGDFSLDGIRELLGALGNPHHALKCLHIAGSKGKGSTAAFAAQILKEAGYRVGLYTSPHFYDVRERIRVLFQEQTSPELLYPDCISRQQFAQCMTEFKLAFEKLPALKLTYFETLTAIAFLYFRNQKADAVVLETGLGGRLDATNVVEPMVCALTCIDLDHTAILGHSYEAIAREKLGIVKSGCAGLVMAPQKKEVAVEAKQVCAAAGVPCLALENTVGISDVEFHPDCVKFKLESRRATYRGESCLLGKYQPVNAAVAVAMVEQLGGDGFFVDKPAVEKGIRSAFWPGRMEVICRNPLLVIDGAHTPESAALLMESLGLHFPQRKIVLILGMSSDKDKESVCVQFARRVSRVILTRSTHSRADAMDDSVIDRIFREQRVPVTREKDLSRALRMAEESGEPGDVILVAGSLFLAAQARAIKAGILG